MFSHIMIPTDGSKVSHEAVRCGINLAREWGAKVTVLNVSPTYRRLTDEGYLLPANDPTKKGWEKGVTERAAKILDVIGDKAKKAGVNCSTRHVFDDSPHHAIVETATKNDCDLIVMGSHGFGGFKHIVLGSETTRVLSHTRIPVLVYR